MTPGNDAQATRKKFLACLAVAFIFTSPPVVHAGLTEKENADKGIDYVVDKDGYNSTVGKGKQTLNASTVEIEEGAGLHVENKNAISVHDNADVTIDGAVSGHITTSGGGNYGTGYNIVESNSNTTITIGKTGSIIKTGSIGNAEAINVHGYGNTITNHGTIKTEGSAAIWFQDSAHGSMPNVVHNYGDIIRDDSRQSVIGTSGGNGIHFYNHSGGIVEGGLEFSKGDDKLIFEAGSSVTGSIDGGGGKNELWLSGGDEKGVGLLTGGIMNFQTLDKVDGGTWVLEGTISGFETTKVEGGYLRLSAGSEYSGPLGKSSITVSSGGTLSGDGIFTSQHITLNGGISPDSTIAHDKAGSDFNVGSLEISSHGKLTFGSDFRYDYDAVSTAADGSKTDTGDNDRLYLGAGKTSAIAINQGGRVNLRTEYLTEEHKYKQLESGYYLLVDSNGAHFNGVDLNSLWSISINGDSVGVTPRNTLAFEYGSSDFGTDDQIWLNHSHNSLTMDWTAGTGNWVYDDDVMKSWQRESGIHASRFEDGDKVHIAFAPPGESAITVTLGDGVAVQGRPIVSGLVIGMNSAGDLGDIDVTINGDGAIVADSGSARGKYLNPLTADGTPLIPTGKLEKYGTGALFLANQSENGEGNLFQDGVDIYGGAVHIAAANVLGSASNRDAVDDSLSVTFKAGGSGGDKAVFLDDYGEKQVTLDNRFIVEDNLSGRAKIGTTGSSDLVLTAAVPATGDHVAVEVGKNATLNLHAQGNVFAGAVGGHIYLTGNDTDVLLHSDSTLVVDGVGNTYVQSGIISDGDDVTVKKSGRGTLQIESDSSITGKTEIGNGVMRIVDGVVYENNVVALGDGFTVYGDGTVIPGIKSRGVVAGGGTVRSKNIVVNGTISPDSIGAKAPNPIFTDSRYGWLTLDASGGGVTFGDGFSMNFDGGDDTDLDSDGLPTNSQDLLILKGDKNPVLATGTIHIDMGDTSFADIKDGYLIIKSEGNNFVDANGTIVTNGMIDGIGNDTGLLKATINGRDADTLINTPRAGIEFVLRDDAGKGGDINYSANNIWLTHDMSSLTMDWTLKDGANKWTFDSPDSGMLSLQTSTASGAHEKYFMNGDKVYLAAASGHESTVLLGDEETPVRVGVSGLVAGMNSTDVESSGNITIAGTGGIRSTEGSAFGVYLLGGYTPTLTPTGALEKYGTGVLTLANSGENYFETGVKLYDGTLELANAGVISAIANQSPEADQFASMTITMQILHPDNPSDTSTQNLVIKTYKDENGDDVTLQELSNRVIVTAGTKNSTLTAEADVTLSGAINSEGTPVADAVIVVGRDLSVEEGHGGAKLTLNAMGANGYGNITLNNAADSQPDIRIADRSLSVELVLSGPGNMYINNGISNGGANTNSLIEKNGGGTVQIHGGENDFGGRTNITDGVFRVLEGKRFGAAPQVFNLVQDGTLAGAGVVHGETLTLDAIISPDRLDVSQEDARAASSEYGVLSLQGNNESTSKVILGDSDSFTYKYNASAPNWKSGDVDKVDANDIVNGDGLKNDLLKISDFTTVQLGGSGGTVSITTDPGTMSRGHLTSGYYLLIAADTGIVGSDGSSLGNSDLKGILDLEINGAPAKTESVRAGYDFIFNNSLGPGGDEFSASSVANSEIWLKVGSNSLQMDVLYSGTIFGDGSFDQWTSRQGQETPTNTKETRFADGDFAYIATPGNLTVKLTQAVVVSGLQTGLLTTDVTGVGDITVEGDFGITAIKTNPNNEKHPIEGDYAVVNGGVLGADQFHTTGKFHKFGIGDTIFKNTGGNMFTEGIDIHDGAVAFTQENQIEVGGGSAITFFAPTTGTQTTTLRPLNTVELEKTPFVVEASGTATFDVGKDENGDDIGLLLSGASSIGGAGSLEKTGVGIMQLGKSDAVSGNWKLGGDADISNGEFRVIGNEAFSASNVTVHKDGVLAGGGTILSSSTGSGVITVHGGIAPDSAVFALGDDGEPIKFTNEASRIGTLTLGDGTGSVTLGAAGKAITDDYFTYRYDVTAPNLPYSQPSNPDEVTNNTYDPDTTRNDLLALSGTAGNIKVGYGTIDFSGPLQTGKYLLVDADQTIILLDGESGNSGLNNLLSGSRNGREIETDSPRLDFEFLFGNQKTMPADSQIWLDIERNTLSMKRTQGGRWDDAYWVSVQKDALGHTESVYDSGDHAYLSNNGSDGYEVDVSVADGAGPHIASGITVDGTGDITLTGTGGLLTTTRDGSTEAKWIEGMFLQDQNPLGQSAVQVTGKFEKKGTGTFTFAHDGVNTFREGIWLDDGMTAFHTARQLGDDGKGIHFTGTGTKSPGLRAEESVEIDNAISIEDGVVAELAAGQGVTFTYKGNMNGTSLSSFKKTGAGKLELVNSATSGYEGTVRVGEGELSVLADYGKTTGFIVDNSGVLSGQGILGATSTGGIIRSGGVLAPKGYSSLLADGKEVTPLTIVGDLTFASGGNFDVTISQYQTRDRDGKYTPVSDWVKVTGGGVVTIDSAANLNVDIDFRNGVLSVDDFNDKQSGHFTIINADAGVVADSGAQFTLNILKSLPRGVTMLQGWNDQLFQLWFEGDGNSGYGSLCNKPNRQEIGHVLDDVTWSDYASLGNLLDYLGGLSDRDACGALDELTGDIVSNTLEAGMKRPWRRVFNRFDRDSLLPVCYDPCAPAASRIFEDVPNGGQLWAEFYANHTRLRYDDNARDSKTDRAGVAVGYDYRANDTTNLGVTFNYSNPRLKQDTGKMRWDDYEVGIYGRTWVADWFEVRGYAGYSHQEYKLDRHVRLPGTANHSGINDRYSTRSGGDSLAASLEVTRPFVLNRHVALRPVAAFDYEQVWMRGFRENGPGETALSYEKSNYKQYMLRFGLHGQVGVTDRVDFLARAQYVRQLNDDGYSTTGVRFAKAGSNAAGQRWAQIRGTDTGRNSVNLGAGLDVKLNREKTRSLYMNFDADLYRNKTTMAGEVGVMLSW